MSKLIINFAPTGIKPTKDWTPNVPISPNEIIEQVHEIYGLGITIVHLHARDNKTGKPDYKSSIYEKIVNGVKKHCKDLVISLSTSGRCFPSIFTAQPDFAKVGLTVKDLPSGSIYALAGLGASQLKVSTYAIASGAPGVRIGIEDNVYYDANKTIFATNLSLAKRIHQIAEIFEREIMKPSEFGTMGFYNSKR